MKDVKSIRDCVIKLKGVQLYLLSQGKEAAYTEIDEVVKFLELRIKCTFNKTRNNDICGTCGEHITHESHRRG